MRKTLFALVLALLVGATASAQTTLEASGARPEDARKSATVSMTGDGVIPGITAAAVSGPLATVANIIVTSREVQQYEAALSASGCPFNTASLPTVINLMISDKTSSSSVQINGQAVIGGISCATTTYRREIDLQGSMAVQMAGITEPDLVANLTEIARVGQLYAARRAELFEAYRACKARPVPSASPAATPVINLSQGQGQTQNQAQAGAPGAGGVQKKGKSCGKAFVGGLLAGAGGGSLSAEGGRRWAGAGIGAPAGGLAAYIACKKGAGMITSIAIGGGAGAAAGTLTYIGGNDDNPHHQPDPPTQSAGPQRVCTAPGNGCVASPGNRVGPSGNPPSAATGPNWRPVRIYDGTGGSASPVVASPSTGAVVANRPIVVVTPGTVARPGTGGTPVRVGP